MTTTRRVKQKTHSETSQSITKKKRLTEVAIPVVTIAANYLSYYDLYSFSLACKTYAVIFKNLQTNKVYWRQNLAYHFPLHYAKLNYAVRIEQAKFDEIDFLKELKAENSHGGSTTEIKKLARLFKHGELEKIKSLKPSMTLNKFTGVNYLEHSFCRYTAWYYQQEVFDYFYMQAVSEFSGNRLKLLSFAAHFNQVAEVKKMLQDKKLDLNSGKYPPLQLAASYGHSKVVALLIEAGADVNPKDAAASFLLEPTKSGSTAIVTQLLEAKADVNKVDTQGQAPIHAAVVRGHHDIVRKFIEAKANLELRHTRYTPLAYAARNRDLFTAKLLLDAKASIENAAAGADLFTNDILMQFSKCLA